MTLPTTCTFWRLHQSWQSLPLVLAACTALHSGLVWRSPILTVRCCGANRFLNNGYTITTRFPSVGLAAQLKNAIIQSSYRLPGAAPHLLPIDASQLDM